MRRLALAIALAVSAAGLGAAAPARAEVPLQLEATATYLWDFGLNVKVHVTGSAATESEVWNPCGGTPPGLVLKYQDAIEPMRSTYALYTTEGAFVQSCGHPPKPAEPVPSGFALQFSRECDGTGMSWRPVVESTLVEAVAGTATREEIRFDYEGTHVTEPGETQLVCVVQNRGFSWPNQECAEYFAPDLCSREHGSSSTPVTRKRIKFVRSRTARCPEAKREEREARKRIKQAKATLRRLPGRQPFLEGELEKAKVNLEFRYLPRRIGECR